LKIRKRRKRRFRGGPGGGPLKPSGRKVAVKLQRVKALVWSLIINILKANINVRSVESGF